MKRIFLIALTFLVAAGICSAQNHDSRYLDIMQCAVQAYTPQHLDEYASSVDSLGITEHGYGRLVSNLGILIAHGRLSEHKERFQKMMDICVREIPVALKKNKGRGEIGNDFAVREVVCCILELESANIFPKETTDAWRDALKEMKAEDIYSRQPQPGSEKACNWCVYGSASEVARIMAGIGGDRAYPDKYFTDQLRFFDANGMYQDPNQPMVYDIVTRLQFMTALSFGYNGPARAAIEENLMKSAYLTLQMQSVTGEIPYGGRSNQFLHNEGFLAAVCEYYASWMKSLGNVKDAERFRAAAVRAMESLDYWTSEKPVHHVKNRYPTETGYGCERYAYFDKYMVTLASWAYLAYRFSDVSIEPTTRPEPASTFVTSPSFHRIMMNAGAYTVQFDLNPDKPYDSAGIGRIQRQGAPCTIAMASPCPSDSHPKYRLDMENEGPLAIAPLWDSYSIVKAKPGLVVLTDSSSTWTCRLGRRGLRMRLEGPGEKRLTLPAFIFDGADSTTVSCDGKSLSITYRGWTCRYTTDGRILPSDVEYANRNGHFLRYDALADRRKVLRVKCTIYSTVLTRRMEEPTSRPSLPGQ